MWSPEPRANFVNESQCRLLYLSDSVIESQFCISAMCGNVCYGKVNPWFIENEFQERLVLGIQCVRFKFLRWSII